MNLAKNEAPQTIFLLFRYIVQPEGLNVGDIVYASRDTLAHINPGSSYAMKLLPIGIESLPPIPLFHIHTHTHTLSLYLSLSGSFTLFFKRSFNLLLYCSFVVIFNSIIRIYNSLC